MTAPFLPHVTTLNIAPDHPAFAGHFPGQPIVPGVVLLDEVLRVAAQGLGQGDFVGHINAAKFLSPVRPHEVVTLTLTAGNAALSMRFDLTAGERKVATGQILLEAASA